MNHKCSSLQFSSVIQSCLTLCDPMDCSMPGLPCPSPTPEVYQNSCPLSRWCHPTISSLSSPSPPPSIFPNIRVSFNESDLRIRWPKYWHFSLSISPSNEHPGLVSFRMDWLYLFAVQGTLKNLLQHSARKHQFFGAQLSLYSNSHIHTWPLEKPQLRPDGPLLAKRCFLICCLSWS